MSKLPSTFVEEFHKESDVQKLSYVKLGDTDMFVSRLALGGGQFANGVKFDKHEGIVSGHDEVCETIVSALKAGINYIDTAAFYGGGGSEIVLGQALKSVPREAYYLATKLGRRHTLDFDFSRDAVLKEFERSLEKLGVDYVDVIQVHDIEFADDLDQIVNETLPTLDELRQNGRVRHIGITGYPLTTLKELVERSETKIDLVLSYCRETLFENELAQFSQFFRDHQLGIINAAIHGMGLLTPHDIPQWHPVQNELKVACKKAVDYCSANKIDIGRLASGNALQSIHCDTVLVGMNIRKVLQANLDVLINGLTNDEWDAIEHIKSTFMRNITQRNWEGVEVSKYFANKDAFRKSLEELFLP